MTELARAVVGATGSYLPGDPISNEDMERWVGPLPDDILEGIQVKTRHWIVDPDTGDHREHNSELALKAARQALDRAGVEPSDVDLIVCSTGSPDFLLPPLSLFVQQGLGLQRCAITDIRSGCNGFVEGLDLARLYIERGQYRCAVVIGSETISPLLVPVFRGKEPNKIRMRDRMNPYNFGDGAGAVVLRPAEAGEPGGIRGSAIAAIGGLKQPGMQIFGGGTATPLHEQQQAQRLVDLKVDVVESGRFSPYVIMEGLEESLRRCGTTAEQIDVCIIPEGNAGYVTEELEEAGLINDTWLTIAPRVVENLAAVGATGSAAVPLALNHAWETGAVRRGTTVLLLAVETSKWAYGGVLVDWTAELADG